MAKTPDEGEMLILQHRRMSLQSLLTKVKDELSLVERQLENAGVSLRSSNLAPTTHQKDFIKEAPAAAPSRRHSMSAAARRRISAAQKARWAAVRKQQEQPAAPAKKAAAKRASRSTGVSSLRNDAQEIDLSEFTTSNS